MNEWSLGDFYRRAVGTELPAASGGCPLDELRLDYDILVQVARTAS
jgi:hypothetical protein